MSFDRAADYYDETRGLPPEQRDAVADLLAHELHGRGRCLEIGVGTGRTALPLHERGVALVGVDLAPSMLARLVVNAGGRLPFPLVVGDVTRLPLADAAFGAVIASHVFHLVPDWEAAGEESRRVLHAGGVMLIDFGGGVPSPWSAATERVFRRHGIERRRPGVDSAAELADHLGATTRALPSVRMTVRRSLAADLAQWEQQVHSWTWSYTAERMHAACADIRQEMPAEGFALDDQADLDRVIQWWELSWQT